MAADVPEQSAKNTAPEPESPFGDGVAHRRRSVSGLSTPHLPPLAPAGHLITSRRLSINLLGTSTGGSLSGRKRAAGGEMSRAAQLSTQVEDLLQQHQLTAYLVGGQKLPAFMNFKESLGKNVKEQKPLFGKELAQWKQRCEQWALAMVNLRDLGVDQSVVSLDFEGIDGSSTIVYIAQNLLAVTPHLRSLSLKSGQLSDNALSSIAMAMKGRLRSLDLTNTNGSSSASIDSNCLLSSFLSSLAHLHLHPDLNLHLPICILHVSCVWQDLATVAFTLSPHLARASRSSG